MKFYNARPKQIEFLMTLKHWVEFVYQDASVFFPNVGNESTQYDGWVPSGKVLSVLENVIEHETYTDNDRVLLNKLRNIYLHYVTTVHGISTP